MAVLTHASKLMSVAAPFQRIRTIAVESHCDDFDDDLLSSMRNANLAFYDISWEESPDSWTRIVVVVVVDVVFDHVELDFDVSNVMRRDFCRIFFCFVR